MAEKEVTAKKEDSESIPDEKEEPANPTAIFY